MSRKLAETIIDAWDQDKLKGKFWHDVVYQQCYPIMQGQDDQSARIAELEQQISERDEALLHLTAKLHDARQQLAALQSTRKTLTQAEMASLIKQSYEFEDMDWGWGVKRVLNEAKLIRLVEQFHGIGMEGVNEEMGS